MKFQSQNTIHFQYPSSLKSEQKEPTKLVSISESNKNDLLSTSQHQKKGLSQSRQDNQRKTLKFFEIIDNIHQRVRHKTKDDIAKLDSYLRSNAQEFYYEKKVDLYELLKHINKKKVEPNIEQLIQRTEVTENRQLKQSIEIKRICSDYNIDLKVMKLPYKEKIRQICTNMSAFYRYKKDQREVLDQSLFKNKVYIKETKKIQEIKKLLMLVKYVGEQALNDKQRALYAKIKEANRTKSQALEEENQKKLQQNKLHEQKLQITENQDEYAESDSSISDIDKQTQQSMARTNDNIKQSLNGDASITMITTTNNKRKSIDLLNNESFMRIDKQGKVKPFIQRINRTGKIKSRYLHQSLNTSLCKKPVNELLQINPNNQLPVFLQNSKQNISSRYTASTRNQQEKSNQSIIKFTAGEISQDSHFKFQSKFNTQQQSLKHGSMNISQKENRTQLTSPIYQPVNLNLDLLRNQGKVINQRRNCQIMNQSFDKKISNYMALNSSHQMDQFSKNSQQFSTNEVFKTELKIPEKLLNNLLQQHSPAISTDYQRIMKRVTQHQNKKRFLSINDGLEEFKMPKQSFKLSTPKIQDKEIQTLIRQYPKVKIENIRMDEENKDIKSRQKQTIDSILKSIDVYSLKNKQEKEEIVYEMLVQNIKNDEFIKTIEKLKDIDFAESIRLQSLYEYKMKDEQDQQDYAHEIAKEFHSARFDTRIPLRLKAKNRMKLKQKENIRQ